MSSKHHIRLYDKIENLKAIKRTQILHIAIKLYIND